MVKNSIYDIPVKNEKRAEIVSIKSPESFAEAIDKLQKGDYTLSDYRSLVLARTRAENMLQRKDLSDKEKQEMLKISQMNIPTNYRSQ